jgi:DNA-directed RNA polymerase specialized sigma24 family protein
MKTRGNGADSQMHRTPAATSSIEALARQIFNRLQGDNRDGSVEDLQGSLTLAANMLARPAAETENAARAALLQLSATQREALLLHLNGDTHVQIAARQGRPAEDVLKDLARAYVRLRFALNPAEHGESQQSTDTESSATRDEPSQTQQI